MRVGECERSSAFSGGEEGNGYAFSIQLRIKTIVKDLILGEKVNV